MQTVDKKIIKQKISSVFSKASLRRNYNSLLFISSAIWQANQYGIGYTVNVVNAIQYVNQLLGSGALDGVYAIQHLIGILFYTVVWSITI